MPASPHAAVMADAGAGAGKRAVIPALPVPEPLLELPGGFPPDTVGFALRTTLAVLLAYYLAFTMQLSSASSAGLCVAIVSQPGQGATIAKSGYRVLGTLIGGVVAVGAMAAFPQDRTMLLAAFTLWMGICTLAASLLRDFGAYGAALAGYTFGIVALTDIDAPLTTFLAAMNRVAAILLGVACAALVNGIFTRPTTWYELTDKMQQTIADTARAVAQALGGDPSSLAGAAGAERAAAILALRTQAGYVAHELQDGPVRAAGARSAIAALLGMISIARVLAFGPARDQLDAATQAAIDRALAALKSPFAPAQPEPPAQAAGNVASDIRQVFLRDWIAFLVSRHNLALDGFRALRTGQNPARQVRLIVHRDLTGASLNGVRAMISTALACIFCVYAGWGGATLMPIQISAYAALLGMAPNPTRATLMLGVLAPAPLLAGWVVKFLLLSQGSNFVLFALALAPFSFIACVAFRHPRLASGGNTMLVLFLLVLTPSNPENYDLVIFLNTCACLVGAILAMFLGFVLILPTSRHRRLFRLLRAITRDLGRTLRRGRRLPPPSLISLQYDRVGSALQWLGPRTQSRLNLLAQLYDLAELDAILSRAHAALDDAANASPALTPAVQQARAALLSASPAPVEQQATTLLEAAPDVPAILRASSSLHAASLVLDRESHLLRWLGLAGQA